MARENWSRAEIREMEFMTEIGARDNAVDDRSVAEENIDALSATPTAA